MLVSKAVARCLMYKVHPQSKSQLPYSVARTSSHDGTHLCCVALDLFDGQVLVVAGELVVRSEEEHAVTLMALAHGHTRAVPIAILSLRLRENGG